jgi:hypothetical protein
MELTRPGLARPHASLLSYPNLRLTSIRDLDKWIHDEMSMNRSNQNQSFTPLLDHLNNGEIEREREKDNTKRRKRNTSRGRDDVVLPSRIRSYCDHSCSVSVTPSVTITSIHSARSFIEGWGVVGPSSRVCRGLDSGSAARARLVSRWTLYDSDE